MIKAEGEIFMNSKLSLEGGKPNGSNGKEDESTKLISGESSEQRLY